MSGMSTHEATRQADLLLKTIADQFDGTQNIDFICNWIAENYGFRADRVKIRLEYLCRHAQGRSDQHHATMAYREYLRTERWQAKRQEALRRAAHRCQVCNSPNRLDVHHRTYANRGNEQPTDLTVLCHECHKLFHDHGKLRH